WFQVTWFSCWTDFTPLTITRKKFTEDLKEMSGPETFFRRRARSVPSSISFPTFARWRSQVPFQKIMLIKRRTLTFLLSRNQSDFGSRERSFIFLKRPHSYLGGKIIIA